MNEYVGNVLFYDCNFKSILEHFLTKLFCRGPLLFSKEFKQIGDNHEYILINIVIDRVKDSDCHVNTVVPSQNIIFTFKLFTYHTISVIFLTCVPTLEFLAMQ